MQIETLQIVVMAATGPALLLLRALALLVPVWIQALRLRYRHRLITALPEGSVIDERYGNEGSFYIQIGHPHLALNNPARNTPPGPVCVEVSARTRSLPPA